MSPKVAAIVTGACTRTGRDVARRLASGGWAIVVVYRDDERKAEATVADILAAEGTTVTVRADLADELDVQRLFAESIAAFGGVDAVVHTTTDSTSLLYQYAAQHVRAGGAIVSVCPTEHITPGVARCFCERGITAGTAPPGAVLSLLDQWRHRAIGRGLGGPLQLP